MVEIRAGILSLGTDSLTPGINARFVKPVSRQYPTPKTLNFWRISSILVRSGCANAKLMHRLFFAQQHEELPHQHLRCI